MSIANPDNEAEENIFRKVINTGKAEITFDNTDEMYFFRVIYGKEKDPITPEFEAHFATKEKLNEFLMKNKAFWGVFMLIQEACEEAGKKFFPDEKKDGEVASDERTSSEEETTQEIYDQNSDYIFD